MRCAAVAVAFVLALSVSCRREQRNVRPAPADIAVYHDAARESDLQPGGVQSQPSAGNPRHGIALDLAEGQRLFQWYNCSGCHANGGGGMGPPLIKEIWIYGGEPANIFDTIVKGRPNGMPAWGGRIPEYQIWQIVTYVESLNQKEPKSITPPRADMIEPSSVTLTNKVNGETK